MLYDNDLLYEGCLARVQSSLEGFRDLSFDLNLLHFNGQRMTYKLTTLVQIFDPGKRMMRTSELAPRIEGLTSAKVKINTKLRFCTIYLEESSRVGLLSQEGGGAVATKGRFPDQEIL